MSYFLKVYFNFLSCQRRAYDILKTFLNTLNYFIERKKNKEVFFFNGIAYLTVPLPFTPKIVPFDERSCFKWKH